MEIETLKEKWFTFRRIPCKEGFIDMWQGDQADDPNREEQSRINLNSFSKMFRLNGEGEWVHWRDSVGLFDDLHNYQEVFTSDDLWYMAQIKTIMRVTGGSKESCGALLEEHGSVDAVFYWFAENQ